MTCLPKLFESFYCALAISRGLIRKVIVKLDLLNLVEFNPELKPKEESFFAVLNPKNWLSDSIKNTLGLVEKPDVLSDREFI